MPTVKSNIPPYVTNTDDNLRLPQDWPVTDENNLGLRLTGARKLKIPLGPLTQYVPNWLSHSGAITMILDDLVLEESEAMRESLAHPDERTLSEWQIEVEGRSLVRNQKERCLDKVAVDLLRRAFPALYGHESETTDAILTHAGFRSGDCANPQGARNAFLLRLVCLQLIIRRGIEIFALQAEQQGEQRFPLFIYSIDNWNDFNWDTAGAQLPPPGTAVKQPTSPAAQDDAKKTRKRLLSELNRDEAPADAAEIARLKAIIADKDSRISDLGRSNQQDGDRSRRPRSGEANGMLPCTEHTTYMLSGMPTVLPNPNTVPGLASAVVANVIAGIEVDPADAVNSQVVSEVVGKFNRGDTLTAEYIHSLICPADKKAVLTVDNDRTGEGFTMSSATASTRKMDQMHQLFTVTDHLADSVASVHPTLGIKIRQKFYTAIRRVERRCNSDVPMVIAYWNRHVNAWIKGLHTSVNVSLNYSRDYADAVQEDMEHSRQSGARKDEQARQIKDLQSKYKRLKSQDGAGAGGGGGGGGGIKKKTAKSAASSSADCVNFLSGKDCKIIDDDGICIFNHDGLTKGSDPDACTKRFGK